MRQREIPVVNVGDKLAFSGGYGRGQWAVHAVSKITPTGRVKCGPYELDPDLSVRGRRGCGWPYYGEVMTPAIAEAVERQHLEALIRDCKPALLSLAQLRAIGVALEGKP